MLCFFFESYAQTKEEVQAQVSLSTAIVVSLIVWIPAAMGSVLLAVSIFTYVNYMRNRSMTHLSTIIFLFIAGLILIALPLLLLSLTAGLVL